MTTHTPSRLQQPVMRPTTIPASQPARILIVDDEPMIAQSIRDLLTLRTPYHLTIAAGGNNAIAKIETTLEQPDQMYDLILLDIDMPLITGLDVLRWIRDQPLLQMTRVVMLTGLDDKRDMVRALEAGADDYITKPYHPQELIARMDTTLRSQFMEKELRRQRRQLALLNTISNTITKTLETKHLLEASAEGVRDLLSARATCVFMHDKSHNFLRCQLVHCDEGEPIAPESFPPIPIGKGVISTSFVRRITHCVNGVSADNRIHPAYDIPHNYPLHTLVASPIFMRGHPIGVLVALNKKHGDFTHTDVDLFVSLTGTISQAIENAWLFRSVRQRQQELLVSRNTLQALIDGILQPIYTVDNQWKVVSINKTKADEEGVDPKQLIGQVCYHAFFQRESPCEHCKVARLLTRNQPQRWNVRWVGDDYLPREWDVNAFPIPTAKDHNASAVIVWQDRTEERRMENSLHQASKLAAIGQLAAGVAHEINNPLTVITTGAEMLKDVTELHDTEDYELVEWINSAAARATKVVRGLLDFARQSRFEFKPGDLKRSLEDTIELIAYQMKKSNIVIECEFDDDLPTVVASWEHLKTVWLNLLLNARDALKAREDNRRIAIVTRTAPMQDHVLILVHDNGEGMSDEQTAHIFEPFFTTKDPGQGTGLGLATCHRIIDRHGGEITVTSELNVGTTFIVRLPISEKS